MGQGSGADYSAAWRGLVRPVEDPDRDIATAAAVKADARRRATLDLSNQISSIQFMRHRAQ